MSADEERARARARRFRTGLFVTVTLLALGGGSFWAWWSRPLADDATVERVGRWATDAMVDARRSECPRSVLRGEPVPGDATAELIALVSATGQFAECVELIGERTEDLAAALRWSDEDTARLPPVPAPAPSPRATPPVPAAGWDYVEVSGPVRSDPMAIETEILAACAGLDTAVERIASRPSVCTPFALGEDHPDLVVALRLEKALAVIARDRVRRGEVRRGLELLLDGVRLGADVERGHPDLLGAMIGVAMVDLALAQLQGLVASELGWQPGDLEELERQALVLARTHPAPAGWIRDDSITTVRGALERRGWVPPQLPERPLGPALGSGSEGEQLDTMIAFTAFAGPRLERLCEGAATREDCVISIDGEIDRARADAEGYAVALGTIFPQLSHEGLNRGLYAISLPSFAGYVARAVQGEARVRALAVLFLHRRLALAGACPSAPDLEAAMASLPLADGFGGRFEIYPSELDQHPLEVCAPAWLAPSGAGPVRLPLLEAYCPALVIREPPAPPATTNAAAID